MVLAISLIFVFVVGACVGSFLNVCIARLPLEKSLLWPSSRCGRCMQPIRWYDNLPIISYLWLRGRCRSCGQRFSPVYLLVELGTALAFVGLFYLEVVVNVHGWHGRRGELPWPWWIASGWHALLLCFLIVASVCDMQSREIPLQLTLTGTIVGLIGATLLPWPWPSAVPADSALAPRVQGAYPWPFWLPLPEWCDGGGNWQTGLVTGLIGALTGTFLLRGIGFVFQAGRGKEGLGLGDADLMMMVGSFLGWQIVVVAFFLSAIPALVFGLIQLLVRKDESLPYGPSLCLSVMITCLAWQPIGERTRDVLHSQVILIAAVVLCGGLMFLLSFAFRLRR